MIVWILTPIAFYLAWMTVIFIIHEREIKQLLNKLRDKFPWYLSPMAYIAATIIYQLALPILWLWGHFRHRRISKN